MSQKLYRVEVSADVYVLAETCTEAEYEAGRIWRNRDGDDELTCFAHETDPETVPKYDHGLIPYCATDNRTIGQMADAAREAREAAEAAAEVERRQLKLFEAQS